ncbi:MAG: hypothetical protein QM831_11915 [Kofleriaceae bacterium]
MDELIETIRGSLVKDASDEARAAGASACRTILTALEATVGQPMTATVTDTSPMSNALAMLRGVPPDKLLDLAIMKLQSALPAGVEAPNVQPLKFHLIQVPRS